MDLGSITTKNVFETKYIAVKFLGLFMACPKQMNYWQISVHPSSRHCRVLVLVYMPIYQAKLILVDSNGKKKPRVSLKFVVELFKIYEFQQ